MRSSARTTRMRSRSSAFDPALKRGCPRLCFAFVGSPSMRPVGESGQRLLWDLVGEETTPPAPAFVTPLLTYQHFTDFYSTYAEFTAAYPSYLEASRDYTVRGS